MKKHRTQQDYTPESLREERRYGIYWYSWLWHLVRPVLIALCVLTVVTGVCMGVWNAMYRNFFAPVDEQDMTQVPFTVESGSSLSKVATNLEKSGLVRNSTVFKYYADFLGYGQKIQAGDYVLTRTMSLSDIADLLTTGDGNPITRNITLIPGWTVQDFAEYLVSINALNTADEFLALCKTGSNFADYYYIRDVLDHNAAQRLYVLEGYLAPDTYEFYTSATAEDIIKKLLSQTEKVFSEEYHQRAEEMDMTMDEVMTLASMIEKEAKTEDYVRVSAIFHNRLRLDMTLGSDVTIKYVSGTKRMALTDSDLSVDSPYNSYRNKGLPPGPVCSPSQAAIHAALYPDETFIAETYLYFCSKDPATGELYFSRTLEEHERAVAIYAPLWEAYDQSQGNR